MIAGLVHPTTGTIHVLGFGRQRRRRADSLCEFRTRYALSALFMFAFISLTSISMSIGVVSLPAELMSALLWIILFFCAMAGLSRVFVQE